MSNYVLHTHISNEDTKKKVVWNINILSYGTWVLIIFHICKSDVSDMYLQGGGKQL